MEIDTRERTENLLADELLAHGPLAAKGLVRLPGKLARRIDLNFAPYDRRAFYTLGAYTMSSQTRSALRRETD